ncbi:MAG: pyridoxamine 5'-phosphate oxidase family protein [Streptosporangiaceae bacterium]
MIGRGSRSDMRTQSIDEFLSEVRVAVLITLNHQAMPVPVPVWYDWDGECAWMFSSKDSRKVRRVREDNRGWLVVHAPAKEPEDWVVLAGTVKLSGKGWSVARRLAYRYWDMSLESSRIAVARWARQADELVAMQLAPSRCSRFVPER